MSAATATAEIPKGHPKGLKALFFTEMWERLGFYLMLGILFLYIIDTERGGLGLPLRQAVEIYGTYMAFVYFTPFLGGMIADRFLGYRRAVAVGGLLMAAGLTKGMELAFSEPMDPASVRALDTLRLAYGQPAQPGALAEHVGWCAPVPRGEDSNGACAAGSTTTPTASASCATWPPPTWARLCPTDARRPPRPRPCPRATPPSTAWPWASASPWCWSHSAGCGN